MAIISKDKYRHEIKYICSQQQLYMIENRIKNLLHLDRHANENGTYCIRSLYFDDYYNSYYYENENGTDPREKFRIRIYNASSNVISLELKKKVRGKTQKISCKLTKEQCEALIHGEEIPICEETPALLNKLLLLRKSNLLQPRVIVEYTRVPFVYKDGNVRITFDKNISSSNQIKDFLKHDILKRPIMPLNTHVLEVKFDEFLPDYIYRNLLIDNLQFTAFSKYYLCRKFSLRGE